MESRITIEAERTTKSKFSSAIDVAFANCTDQDTAFFYYCGHGDVSSTSGTGLGLTLGGGTYSYNNLLTKLSNVTCKHIFVVLSCCNSGAARSAYNKLSETQKQKVSLFWSSGANEPSNGADNVTNFTHYGLLFLCEALSPNENKIMPADANKNGIVTDRELGAFIVNNYHNYLPAGQTPDSIMANENAFFAAFKIPAAQYITKVENVADGIRITWPKSLNAEGYKIYRKANNGTWKVIKTIKDVNTIQYIDDTANNGVLYTYTVKGYIEPNLSEHYNKTGLKMYRLSRVYITECKNPSGGKATLEWSKRGVADGYFVYYSQSSKFETFTKEKREGADNTSITLSGLAKGKTYYFKVRPYKIIDGKTYYGTPSSVKNVKIKNPIIDITKASIRVNKGKTYTLAVTLTDISKSNVNWVSSNTSVATVNSSGVVTAVKVGTATITASGGGASDTCKVTVFSIPTDAIQYNGHYYKRFETSLSWPKAQAACKKLGGHLVTITSAEEESAMEDLIADGKQFNYWIGLKIDSNGKFTTWVTGEKVDYTHWASGQPSNAYGGIENCAHLCIVTHPESVKRNKWNDLNENGYDKSYYYWKLEYMGYICEWEKLSPN